MSRILTSSSRFQNTSTLLFCSCCAMLMFAMGCVEPDADDGNELLIIEDTRQDMSPDHGENDADMSPGVLDSGKDDGDIGPPPGPSLGCEGDAFSGEVYLDTNLSAVSRHVQRRDDEDVPIEGEPIVLIGKDIQLESQTCAGGTFGASKLPDGPYLFGVKDLAGRQNTSSNQGGRLIEAALAGETANVLVFGDSIPAWGPQPWYPAQLEAALKRFIDLGRDSINAAHTVHFDKLLAFGIDRQQRSCLRIVGFNPLLEGFRIVVVTPLLFIALGHSIKERGFIDTQPNHTVHFHATLFERLVERFCLRHGSGKSVKDEASSIFMCVKLLLNELDNDGIRDQLARIHDRCDAFPELCASAARCTKHVAC